MTKIGKIIIFLCFIVSPMFAAATTSVQSMVDRNEMSIGDTFTLTISVSSDEEVQVQDPRIPDLDGFELLNQWQSSAVSQKLVGTPNGMQFETQRRKDFHFMLSPKKTGNLSVSSFEVVASGKVYRTQPIVIQVDAQGQGRSGPRHPRQRPGMQPDSEDPFEAMDKAEEQMFNQLLQQRQRLLQQMGQMPDENIVGSPQGARPMPDAAFRSLPKNPNEAFFISVEVDKTEVFEGEQVTVNWYLYTRGGMETLDRLKFPSLRGFWKEIIEEVPAIQFTQEVVNGLPWKKALLASHALFPIKPGTAVIDEYKIKSRVRMPTQGLGGMYGPAYEYTKSSERVEIKVKPLPVEGRPSDFSGAVGQFEVHASVENNTIPVNQPLSFRVRFEGAGNAKLIELPAIAWPNGIEQYDTKTESKFFKNGRSYKEFEVLLIPRQEGDLQIPAFTVSMFDPRTKKYYSRSTEQISLKVINNPNAPVGSSTRLSGDTKSGVNQSAAELQLPAPVAQWRENASVNFLSRPWMWAFIYLAISGILFGKAAIEFGWGQRRRSLKDLVQKRYKKVDAALAKSDFRLVGGEMTNIFYIVLGEVAGIGGASREIGKLLEMVPPSLRRDHGDQIGKKFEVFQTLSFAPEEMLGTLKEKDVMQKHVDEAKKVISSVIAAVEAQ